VLLVNGDVPAPTAVELARLNPATVYVVGGTSVVSNTVASKL
jgi:putative cell wall-binding protein